MDGLRAGRQQPARQALILHPDDEDAAHPLEYDAALVRLAVLEGRKRIVEQIFWASLREDFPEIGGRTVGVRAGWQVVTLEDRSSQLAADLLGSLLAAAVAGQSR